MSTRLPWLQLRSSVNLISSFLITALIIQQPNGLALLSKLLKLKNCLKKNFLLKSLIEQTACNCPKVFSLLECNQRDWDCWIDSIFYVICSRMYSSAYFRQSNIGPPQQVLLPACNESRWKIQPPRYKVYIQRARLACVTRQFVTNFESENRGGIKTLPAGDWAYLKGTKCYFVGVVQTHFHLNSVFQLHFSQLLPKKVPR